LIKQCDGHVDAGIDVHLADVLVEMKQELPSTQVSNSS